MKASCSKKSAIKKTGQTQPGVATNGKTCIESKFGTVSFKGRAVLRSLKYVHIFIPILFIPPPKLVHPVAIEVDKKVPGKKKYWGEMRFKAGKQRCEEQPTTKQLVLNPWTQPWEGERG